ncbi:hypothetical protein BD414DRAFT_537309 [Trametes punicea]|nr:hypothetical protein BD414DRAFT_537309 [Trametes punicea]
MSELLAAVFVSQSLVDSVQSTEEVRGLSAMLEEFVSAEQDAVTYGGCMRDYLPNELERTTAEEIQNRSAYGLTAVEQDPDSSLTLHDETPLVIDDDCPELIEDEDDDMDSSSECSDYSSSAESDEDWLSFIADDTAYEDLAGRNLMGDFYDPSVTGDAA